MNAIVTLANKNLTMTSREIADLTGKDHGNVMRDIRAMVEAISTDSNLKPCAKSTTYTGKDGRQYHQYELDKDTCLTLLLGYDAVARMKVVKRWQELEAAAAAPMPATLSRMQILEIAMESEKARIEAEAQRDEAVRTKALIGSKREATAMATASAAKREVEKLKEELGRNREFATVIAVENAIKREFPNNAYVDLRREAKASGIAPLEVPDKRYVKVKAWPAIAWKKVFGIELPSIFPGPMGGAH